MAVLPEPLQPLDIKILQGAKFSIYVNVKNGGVAWTDLASATITGAIKQSFGSELVLAAFDIVKDPAVQSAFTVSLSADVTASLHAKFPGSLTREAILGVYDIKADFGSGVVYRLLQGQATLSREVE